MPHPMTDLPYARARTNWKPTLHLAATAGQPDLDKMVKRALPATSQADEVPGRKGKSILKDLSRSKEEHILAEREPAPFSSDALGRPLPVFRKGEEQ